MALDAARHQYFALCDFEGGPMKESIHTAFILGAGLGTRLRPLTESIPKPLLPLAGRPMITYAMEHLRNAGIRRFIINTHHCAEKYAGAFPGNCWQGIPITFRHEPILLDTAGGIKNIEDLLGDDERILIYNGDIITNLPLAPLIGRHIECRTEATLALRSRGPLLNVNIDSEGFICDMRNTLSNPGVQICLFAGIYIVERTFLKRLTAGRIESVVIPLIECIRKNRRLVAGVVIDDGFWYDLGTIEEYRKLNSSGF
jgi:NDP-sugar pyrophosphorylase family protein